MSGKISHYQKKKKSVYVFWFKLVTCGCGRFVSWLMHYVLLLNSDLSRDNRSAN